MQTNPFEAADEQFLALRNHEGQYSLWPATIDVPEGWEPQNEPSPRDVCLKFIEQNWVDLRPKSVVLEAG